MVYPENGVLFSTKKEMSYQTMKKHGGVFKAYYYGEEANLKGLHTVLVQRYDILEKAQLWKSSMLPRGGWWGEIKRQSKEDF